MKTFYTLILLTALTVTTGVGQPNCAALPSGFTPINDLGSGLFTTEWGSSWLGGLYPGGSNFMPPSHKAAGLQMASQVQCLGPNGNPNTTNGKMVWLSVGMSNTTQETQQFIPMANVHPNKNPKLVLVDGAMGGQSASVISAPWHPNYNNYWNTVSTRLANAGVSAAQVQVIWFKEADQAQNYSSVHEYYDSLLVMIPRIMNEIKARFPNVKLCYMASRISARYATTGLNPEPYSYYTGWAVKKVIEEQINGNPQLQYSGVNANSPWLSWGIYMWSDGEIPQTTNPNVLWNCPADFQNDGTHPSAIGAQKVANLLLDFFTTDSTATPWFLGTGCPVISTSVQNISDPSYFEIYPNPARNSINVHFINEMTGGIFILYDSAGNQIRMIQNINGKYLNINSQNLPAGIYFAKVFEKNTIPIISKVIVE